VLLLVGDFNLPGINWDKLQVKPCCQYKKLHQEFLDLLNENSLTQLITEPTHVHGNTLDLLCTNEPKLVVNTGIIKPGVSDHHIITATLNMTAKLLGKPDNFIIKLYRNADTQSFQQHMQSVTSELAELTDLNDMWSLFTKRLKEGIDKYVPQKEIKPKATNLPNWFGKQAEKLISKQRKTYNNYKKTGDNFYLCQYKQQRRESKKEIKKMKKDYLVDRICGPLSRGNSKPFFKHLRGNKQTLVLSLIDKMNHTTDDPQQCADLLNNYFRDQFCQDLQIIGVPKLEYTGDMLQISETGVAKLITSLKNGKSPGPDGIRKPDLLVHLPTEANCLSQIFRASLQSGKLPDQWKMAHVVPVHKGGELNLANNYRPISLTSIPCKLLEHIVLHFLNEKLDNILHNRQHGFRKGMSCETQLCATFHDLAKTVESSKTTHALILDFKKAFDKVPHSLLLQKLQRIPGLHPQLANWIQDFLTERTQRVVVKGTYSGITSVTSGVPQGSVLGPTLFLLYINDLPANITCNISLYADDTLLYQHVNNDLESTAFQNNINEVYKWSQKWKMPFNISKCHVITFGNYSIHPTYYLGSAIIPWAEQTKYLGVIFQSNLRFDDHIKEKTEKAGKILGAIKYLLHSAPTNSRLLAYTSLCRPILEYADTVWDPTTIQQIDSIESIQNRAVRFISNLKGRESLTAAKEQLCLDSLADRRKRHRLGLLMKILQNATDHQTLSSSYDEILNDRKYATMTTHCAAKGQPTSILALKAIYHNSFLPRTIRDLKLYSPETS
jgi:hypothetical protein